MAGRGLNAAARVAAAATLALAGCATVPAVPVDGARFDLPPYRAVEANTGRADVVWGGMIVTVRNRVDATEIEVLAYPLDRRLRPIIAAPSEGRFIATVPGYLEPRDWPEGRFLTLRGRLVGAREAPIDERPYRFPRVEARALHRWPAGFQQRRPRVSFGIGIGID